MYLSVWNWTAIQFYMGLVQVLALSCFLHSCGILYVVTTLVVSGASLYLAVMLPTYKRHSVMPSWIARTLHFDKQL